jgi:hypothetical protein
LETPTTEPAPPGGYDFLGEGIDTSGEIPSNEKDIDAYVENIKQQKIDDIQSLDVDKLIDDGKDKMIDYIMAAPGTLRPYAEKENDSYAFMRAQDTLETSLAKAQVTKTITDNNG